MTSRSTRWLPLCAALLATACAVQDPGQAAAPAPSETVVALVGTVSGSAGALTFHQQPLRTGSALVTAQGRPSAPAKIRPGSVIRGSATKGGRGYELLSAEVHHELEGGIERVDLAASRLVVMGQVVWVGAGTGIGEEGPEGTSRSLQLADLQVGDRVEVDGFLAVDGTLQATRIEQVPTAPDPEGTFHGVIDALHPATRTARVGGRLVAFGTAQVLGHLAQGARVEVQGRPAGQTLRATWVKVESGLEDLAGTTLEICGPISGFDPLAKTFLLMSYRVDYSQARVEGTLANGTRVLAQAPLVGAGAPPGGFTRVRVAPRIEGPVLSARAAPWCRHPWAREGSPAASAEGFRAGAGPAAGRRC